MLAGRNEEIGKISGSLCCSAGESDFAKIVAISGIFGSGKTAVIEETLKKLNENDCFRCVLSCENYKDIAFIPDFTHHLAAEAVFSSDDSLRFEPRESEYVHLRYIDNLIKIKESDFESFNTLLKRIILKSVSDNLLDATKKTMGDKWDYSEIYNSFFDKNGDKAMMKNIGEYAAEALIVDLMNYFFPLSGDKPTFEHYLAGGGLPVRILIVIDDADTVADSLLDWLTDTFIPYCTVKSFHDFISFDFEGGSFAPKVAEFLDFRFLFSARHNYSNSDRIISLKQAGSKVLEINLAPLEEEQMTELIKNYGHEGEISTGMAMETTAGNPFAASMWIESRSYSANNFDSFLLPLIVEQIFKYSAAYEADWIRNAVFLDIIDRTGLKCFPVFDGSATKAMHYFGSMNSICINSKDGGLFIIPEIRKFIRKSIEIESAELYAEMSETGRIVAVQRELMIPFGDADSRLICHLAYFRFFDPEYPCYSVLGEAAGDVKRLVEEYPHFFEEKESKLMFKQEVYKQLDNYNRIADRDKYSQNLDYVKQCWVSYLDYISAENDNIKSELSAAAYGITESEAVLKQTKQDYTEQRVRFMRDENELIGLKVSLDDYSINKNLYSSVSYFSIAIILGVAGYFITEAFSDSPNISSFQIIQYILYGLAALSGIVGGIFGIKSLASNSKAEYEKLKKLYEEKFESKEQKQEAILKLRADAETIEKKIRQLKEKEDKLNERLRKNEEKIKLPFYSELSELSI